MTRTQADTHRKPLLILETTLLEAETQRSCRHYEQTRILFEKAYTHAHFMYGPAHPVLIEISGKIANAYRALGKYRKSSEMQKICVDALSHHFGKSHPRTLEAAKRLAGDLKLLPPALRGRC